MYQRKLSLLHPYLYLKYGIGMKIYTLRCNEEFMKDRKEGPSKKEIHDGGQF